MGQYNYSITAQLKKQILLQYSFLLYFQLFIQLFSNIKIKRSVNINSLNISCQHKLRFLPMIFEFFMRSSLRTTVTPKFNATTSGRFCELGAFAVS